MKRLYILIIIGLFFTESQCQVLKNADTISLNGIDLYFEVYGEGQPLILLHGWTQSSQYWSEYVAKYAQLFEVYLIDLRGHGRTTPLTKDFSIEAAAKDIADLMDYLNLKKAKAIGLSYGGMTLLQLANMHPDRIESMVLIGASHNYSGQDNQELFDEKFKFENLPPSFLEELQKVHFYGDDQIEAFFDPELNYEIRLTEEDLKLIPAKTLIIHGDRDDILGVNAAFELHKNLSNSYLWIVPDAGHIPISGVNESEFLRLTIEFLE